MKKNVSKLIAVALVLALVFSMASVAFAAQTLYATQAVNVRTGPGTNYTVMGWLKKGAPIQATGSVVSGWTQVQYSTYELGYVKSNYLSSSTGATTPSVSTGYTGKATAKVCPDCGTIYQTTGRLNIRSGPGTKYAVIGSLVKGQQVTRTGQSGSWFKILTNEGINAYVSSKYLKAAGPVYNAYCPTTPNFGVQRYPEGTSMYTTTALNMRKGPGTNYEVLTSIPANAKVRYLDNVGNWYRISWGGYVGYSSGSYLTTNYVGYNNYCYSYSNYCGYCGQATCNGTCWSGCSNPNSTGSYFYAQVGGIYQLKGTTTVYASPAATSTVVGSIQGGRYVQVTGIISQSNFTEINYDNGLGGGLSGYVYTTALY